MGERGDGEDESEVELIRENACMNHSSTSHTPPRSGNINLSPGCLPTRRPLTVYLVLGCRLRKAGGRKSAIPLRAGRNSCGEHGGLHLRHRGRELRACAATLSVVGAVLACFL